jgi:hypothetical protein
MYPSIIKFGTMFAVMVFENILQIYITTETYPISYGAIWLVAVIIQCNSYVVELQIELINTDSVEI